MVDNPFRGTPEPAGLKTAMMFLSNWDAKDAPDTSDSNNGVFREAEQGTPRSAAPLRAERRAGALQQQEPATAAFPACSPAALKDTCPTPWIGCSGR